MGFLVGNMLMSEALKVIRALKMNKEVKDKDGEILSFSSVGSEVHKVAYSVLIECSINARVGGAFREFSM